MKWNMEHKSSATNIAILVFIVLLCFLSYIAQCQEGKYNEDFGVEYKNVSQIRMKRRVQPKNGFFFPIAMYTVRHHRPSNSRGRVVRPESWEYRGQYFYGYRPRPNSGRRRAARLLAAGLPLLLAPLLSILFSFPVVVPVTQMTTFGIQQMQQGGRRRKREAAKEARMKELRVVSDYLHQVDYDEQQQARVMVNYLQCNGLLGTDDHCLERLSCEFGDPANEQAPELERTVTSILLGHLLNNDFIPQPFKKRLKSAAQHGRHNTGQCKKFFCHYVDNNWDYASMHAQPGTETDYANHHQVAPQGLSHLSTPKQGSSLSVPKKVT
ncbi:hypothetical protein JTE90_011947 [Oedothorax gibbosus]|uniref:Uncharacterized protein n=1 Tax=Oedothorax gibbosus TaxID=931172 RepID=A0AAV6V2X5_9ARAC|nr:hypothetical protein JTE90_011947 [Oedothorax gibbosus]